MKKAFTLAEVLITLSIIGVIASMTIPSLIQDVQDAQYKTAWKKAFSDLNQVTVRLRTENAGTLSKLCPSDDHNCLKNQFLKYMNYIKSCDRPVAAGTCWHKQEISGTHSVVIGDDAAAILNNGMFVAFDWDSQTCSFSQSGLSNICAKMIVDINGFKGPNQVNKDIYGLWLLKDKLVPCGSGDNLGCSANSIGCSAKLLYQ